MSLLISEQIITTRKGCLILSDPNKILSDNKTPSVLSVSQLLVIILEQRGAEIQL